MNDSIETHQSHQYKIGKNVKTSNLRWTLFETDFEIQTWLNALSDFFAIH